MNALVTREADNSKLAVSSLSGTLLTAYLTQVPDCGSQELASGYQQTFQTSLSSNTELQVPVIGIVQELRTTFYLTLVLVGLRNRLVRCGYSQSDSTKLTAGNLHRNIARQSRNPPRRSLKARWMVHSMVHSLVHSLEHSLVNCLVHCYSHCQTNHCTSYWSWFRRMRCEGHLQQSTGTLQCRHHIF